MQWTVEQLAEHLGAALRGLGEGGIRDVASLADAGPQDVTFVESVKQLKQLIETKAGAVLVTTEVADRALDSTAALLVVPDAFRAFLACMDLFRPARVVRSVGISPQAWVDPTARIAAGTEVHPGAYIGADVQIGQDCLILPGAVIRDGAVLGDNCTIHANAVLYPDIRLGNRVIIHANAVIGADGFGYRLVKGALERIPHRGTVHIHDDVEIGACATVDRAMIGATVIGRGTKIDNLVMIAHNCQIGKHNAFASQVGFAGSCKTGDYVRAGGQVGVADHITIGSQVSFGGQAGVITNVPDGSTYHGTPAGPEKDEIRKVLTLRKAPEVFEQVKQLTKQLAALQAQVAALTSSSDTDSAAA